MDLLKSLGFEGGKDADENAVFVAIYPDAPQYSPLSSGQSESRVGRGTESFSTNLGQAAPG